MLDPVVDENPHSRSGKLKIQQIITSKMNENLKSHLVYRFASTRTSVPIKISNTYKNILHCIPNSLLGSHESAVNNGDD